MSLFFRRMEFAAIALAMAAAPAQAQKARKAAPVPKPAASRAAAPRKAKPRAPARSRLVLQARRLLLAKDYLGFRIWVRKAYAKPMKHSEWYDLKNLVISFASKSGYDLIPYWNARNPRGKSGIDLSLEEADGLMLAGKFNDAFELYQKVAQKIRRPAKPRPDFKALYPYVLHSMARALFGAGRFEDSMKAYQWIGANYPRFRQTLFEKMWAAFKAGNVAVALGAVASQRSAYFSRFLSPEAYLVQTYIYKRLCRSDDVKQVIDEMKAYEEDLKKGDNRDWISGDLEAVVLWRLAEDPGRETDDLKVVSKAERAHEQAQIKEALQRAFVEQRPKILADLKTATAYAHLAKVTDTRDVLKPVEALKSREELLKQDLEIWPADSTEEWADELGKHVLIGESLCNKSETAALE